MPEPLSEQKLAEWESNVRLRREGPARFDHVSLSTADLDSLLAEVRLGREALKALEDLYVEDTHGPKDRPEIPTTDAEHAALAVLRKAGRR